MGEAHLIHITALGYGAISLPSVVNGETDAQRGEAASQGDTHLEKKVSTDPNEIHPAKTIELKYNPVFVKLVKNTNSREDLLKLDLKEKGLFLTPPRVLMFCQVLEILF